MVRNFVGSVEVAQCLVAKLDTEGSLDNLETLINRVRRPQLQDVRLDEYEFQVVWNDGEALSLVTHLGKVVVCCAELGQCVVH